MIIFVSNTICMLLQFNALKYQLSMQRCEPSTTAHMVRKLLMVVVVAFGTTVPNRPSVITLFGCFRCLDIWIKDLHLAVHSIQKISFYIGNTVASISEGH
jgi:hypothetical protein